ncbi:hypothetical protein F4777DRAFT_568638 [Nemania sp. FL0916]|nr:hypothetical protein F4777DRAFT_568638 [Nemania sp. FL0916]
MIKFTRESHNLHVIISKIARILVPTDHFDRGTNTALIDGSQTNSIVPAQDRFERNGNISQAQNLMTKPVSGTLQLDLTAEFHQFRLISNVNKEEEQGFFDVTFFEVQAVCNAIQADQERRQSLIYMRRLDPMLAAMKEFGDMVDASGISHDNSFLMAYIWGPMRLALDIASSIDDVFNSVLNSYQDIGEQMPRFQNYRSLIMSKAYLRETLVLIYKDILSFHAAMIQQLKRRGWKKVFRPSWAEFVYRLQPIKESIARSKRSIENDISIIEFEKLQMLGADALHTFQTNCTAQAAYHRTIVLQWLAPFDCWPDHYKHRQTRSICTNPGTWLLDEPQLKEWMDPESIQTPLLWLRGIPGAGKTILASVMIDKVRCISDTTAVFMYCKYGETLRNTLVSLARSILAQILEQNPHLLPYFHEKACSSGDALLTL